MNFLLGPVNIRKGKEKMKNEFEILVVRALKMILKNQGMPAFVDSEQMRNINTDLKKYLETKDSLKAHSGSPKRSR